ncbi:MAG TPA: monooxygenase, partial [Gammaproteobacteria bacterium]|nr:monooxygenase [Gammaproteobacteria bacterium]
FMLCPSLSPGGYIEFVEKVVPELQTRKVFRIDYKHATFRENLQD